MRRRSIGRTTGCYPVDAGSSPAVAAAAREAGRLPLVGLPSCGPTSMPRSSSGSRMPVSHTGDAGSNPARGSNSFARRNPQERIPPLGSPPCGRGRPLKASASRPQPPRCVTFSETRSLRSRSLGLRGTRGSPPRALGRVWRCGLAVSRVRRVRFPSRALLAVAQWMSAALLPRAMGVRLLPARLRRKACSEPAGCESVEQGAIPWRRLCGAQIGIR